MKSPCDDCTPQPDLSKCTCSRPAAVQCSLALVAVHSERCFKTESVIGVLGGNQQNPFNVVPLLVVRACFARPYLDSIISLPDSNKKY